MTKKHVFESVYDHKLHAAICLNCHQILISPYELSDTHTENYKCCFNPNIKWANGTYSNSIPRALILVEKEVSDFELRKEPNFDPHYQIYENNRHIGYIYVATGNKRSTAFFHKNNSSEILPPHFYDYVKTTLSVSKVVEIESAI